MIIPSSYTITSDGIVGDKLLALKFPLHATNLRINERRNFVEFISRHSDAGTFGPVLIRLYSKNPKRIYEILNSRFVAFSYWDFIKIYRFKNIALIELWVINYELISYYKICFQFFNFINFKKNVSI